MEDFGFIPLLSSAEMLRDGFIKPLLAAWYVHPNPV